nr:uncharacterized protein LOC112737136 isoform X2 [Arachis hypogaea]
MASFTVQTDKVNTLDTNKSSKSNFLSFIGAHEIFMPLTWVAALRELVLNYMLMFMQTGSIIRCLDSNEVDPKLGYLGYAGVGFNPTSCLGPFAEKWIIGE